MSVDKIGSLTMPANQSVFTGFVALDECAGPASFALLDFTDKRLACLRLCCFGDIDSVNL